MFVFEAEQIAPNALAYTAKKITKGSIKEMKGEVRTLRVKDFDYAALVRFAEAGARYELDPPVVVVQSVGKGMHGGAIMNPALKKSRRARKSHAERRAQIVGRSKK